MLLVEAEFKNEFVQTFICSAAAVTPQDLAARFAALSTQAQAWLATEEVPEPARCIRHSLDLRHEQQGFEVTLVQWGNAVAHGDSAASDRQLQLAVPWSRFSRRSLNSQVLNLGSLTLLWRSYWQYAI